MTQTLIRKAKVVGSNPIVSSPGQRLSRHGLGVFLLGFLPGSRIHSDQIQKSRTRRSRVTETQVRWCAISLSHPCDGLAVVPDQH
jgi:hypothetical protein